MRSEIRFDEATQIVRIEVSGDITVEGYLDVMRRITSSNEYPSNINVIWDMREADFFNVDLELMSRLKDARREFQDERIGARAAIIVSGDIEASLIRLFSDVADVPNAHIKIFSTLADAEKWCGQVN